MTAGKYSMLAIAGLLSACATVPQDHAASGLSSLTKVATVDERFQSYNVEMVEVTGGRFWAPYGGPPGEVYRMRPPLDLANPRLRNLARHLGPAYMRVSGTWANSTYIPAEGETVTAPPEGFNQVLTRDQWRGVVAFAKAVDARIATSFPASPGARNADGSWNPAQAQRLIDLTREAGGTIDNAELYNEPTLPRFGAFPKDYGLTDYVRDFRIFHDWARKAAPEMRLAGTGGTAEGSMMKEGPQTQSLGLIRSEDMLKGNPGSLDVVTYHFYGTVSQRCGSPPSQKDQALTADWLDRTLIDEAYYRELRDRFEPGKPLWLNETAQAACGGSPWAATFLDTFRYLNQLGLLAQKGVQVVMHNTLSASDYGLIDQDTLVPRPNYWAAVLWRQTMGTTVLAAPASPSPDMRIYAHCLAGTKGGVSLVAINLGSEAQPLAFGGQARAWTMTGQPLETRSVLVNGKSPEVDAEGSLKGLEGVSVAERLEVPGQAIAFVAVPGAGNAACR